ncbi:hypothetical protein PoB_004201800 [Plakobranchus ocellatus]|uniref:Uncharacterized protein n=1 Tax=Plakobranchus ocellatus TaxID=259542 RepID=A0AAV4B8M3_9GAST|nr:hypothetical protein PoB_004201800 [Plakobranchus ocellatus]
MEVGIRCHGDLITEQEGLHLDRSFKNEFDSGLTESGPTEARIRLIWTRLYRPRDPGRLGWAVGDLDFQFCRRDMVAIAQGRVMVPDREAVCDIIVDVTCRFWIRLQTLTGLKFKHS